MKLVDLTHIQFYLISLVDADKHRDVTFEDVKQALDSGKLFSWLGEQFPDDVDVSFYVGERAYVGDEVTKTLADISGGVDGRERKKLAIENNGICLLIAYINEAIQRGDWPR